MTISDWGKSPRAHYGSLRGLDSLRDLVSTLRRSEGGRFFARPLLDTLAFSDSDAPAPEAMYNVFRLNPRVVVHTSAVGLVRNYQA